MKALGGCYVAVPAMVLEATVGTTDRQALWFLRICSTNRCARRWG